MPPPPQNPGLRNPGPMESVIESSTIECFPTSLQIFLPTARKVMFSQVCISHSVHNRSRLILVSARLVRILLECFLVRHECSLPHQRISRIPFH